MKAGMVEIPEPPYLLVLWGLNRSSEFGAYNKDVVCIMVQLKSWKFADRTFFRNISIREIFLYGKNSLHKNFCKIFPNAK